MRNKEYTQQSDNEFRMVGMELVEEDSKRGTFEITSTEWAESELCDMRRILNTVKGTCVHGHQFAFRRQQGLIKGKHMIKYCHSRTD